jgi:glycine/D-amino acid oxidase-like deaminating enzyme
MGLRLPQLKVQASVARTAPLDNGPDCAALGSDFAFRKRADGGYTVTKGLSVRTELVPDTFRFANDFLPLFRSNWGPFTPAVGAGPSRSWRCRVDGLDPTSRHSEDKNPDPVPRERLDQMLSMSLFEMFPSFTQARIVQHWAVLIDTTPDVVPVISAVDEWPGFFVATGFSGHGFGIGPGAGRLMADLVTGAAPIVDPKPFRFERFSDGSRSQPRTGI